MFIENKKSDNMLEMLNRKSDKNKITKNTNDTSKQRYPKEIIYFPVPYKDRTHPTQKPIALFEYLIKTYTNEGMLVLDCFGGSGTTAIACLNTNRQFIVMEKEQKYYDIIKKRVGDFNKKFETQTLFGNEM
jgi:DNA modification methylase